ncbi:dipeptide epimerase [uncultured Hymenobacter sp.]|uniref:dipeptide epimerase n=1 Tax=uncultured Hymenobacter sp. TaxID=170016 RepID=UPI0035CB4A84
MSWTLTTYELPLRYVWKIARGAASTKTNLVVALHRQGRAGRGEAAPNLRYGETPAALQAEFAALQAAGLDQVGSLAALDELLAAGPVSHALSFALEAALTHWLAARAGQEVWQFLGVPRPARQVPTAFTLPIMPPGEVAGFLRAQGAARFSPLKIKLNQDEGLDLLREVTRRLPGHPLLLDGNEAWPDADGLLRFLENIKALPGLNVRLLEQPLPAAAEADYRALRARSPYPLIADESVTDAADFAAIAQQFHGVNMKLMKAGGYRRGLDLLRQTRAHGLLPMIGCMVETSLGIWSALQISTLADVHDLDGALVVRDEPFGLVQEANGALTAQEGVGIS